MSNNRFNAAPNLVIEILSSGAENHRRDLKFKRTLYGKYGVEEYWIVDGDARTLSIYRVTGSQLKEEAVFAEADTIVSTLLPELNLNASLIFKV